jgi:hypothetical protein
MQSAVKLFHGVRIVWAATLLALLSCVSIGSASAAADPSPLPVYSGGMPFPTIHSAADPEEYSWEVELEDTQELVAIDDRHAEVYSTEDHHPMTSISAEPARDADGSNVPTSLAVSAGNIITLTVHHRAGDPVAGGAPFDYPVTYGPAFEVGFSTVRVVMPPDEPRLPEGAEEGTGKPKRILVSNSLGSGDLVYRPHRFYLSADGTFGMLGVQWKHYGGAVATASASAYANDCVPFCAAGHFSRPKAKLRLTKVVRCGGDYLYARLLYALEGHVPSNIPRRGSFSILPRNEVGEVDC